jgi:alpha-ketoglutarate-dependent taurine dioxygenase
VNKVTSLKVRPPSRSFGAVQIEGLIPADASDPSKRDLVRDLLARHAVVCIRLPKALEDGEARALASMIGPIKNPVGRTQDGNTIRYSDDRQVIDAGFVLTEKLRSELGDLSLGGLDPLRPGLFETFHSDDTYTERPASATVLHARELPSGPGGDTCFLDMRVAFQLLEPDRRQQLIGRLSVNCYNNRDAFPQRVSAKGSLEQLVEVTHPIVRAHPLTGVPALYIDLDRATGIEGMSEKEGRALLQSLQDHAEECAPRYAHAWHPHDVLIWDNASVQHKASGDFPMGEPRRFWRYMIEGSKPIAYQSHNLPTLWA